MLLIWDKIHFLNFKKESAAFAKALQQEHLAAGLLLDEMVPGQDRDSQSECVVNLRKAYEAVRAQHARTEAAVDARAPR